LKDVGYAAKRGVIGDPTLDGANTSSLLVACCINRAANSYIAAPAEDTMPTKLMPGCKQHRVLSEQLGPAVISRSWRGATYGPHSLEEPANELRNRSAAREPVQLGVTATYFEVEPGIPTSWSSQKKKAFSWIVRRPSASYGSRSRDAQLKARIRSSLSKVSLDRMSGRSLQQRLVLCRKLNFRVG
jgi:hypothetical protein